MDYNENFHYRGLHIVILDPRNGSPTEAHVFDTNETSKEFDAFIEKGVPEGHIVIAACKDDCVKEMSQKGKDWFEAMGSKEIEFLKYR